MFIHICLVITFIVRYNRYFQTIEHIETQLYALAKFGKEAVFVSFLLVNFQSVAKNRKDKVASKYQADLSCQKI